MKKYRPELRPNQIGGYWFGMAEDKKGKWVEYEDMENLITNFINNLLHWDNAREVAQEFLKEDGGVA